MRRFLSSRPGFSQGRDFGLRRAATLVATAGLALAGLAAAPAAGVSAAVAVAPRPHLAPGFPLTSQRPLAVPHASRLPSSVRRVCPVPTRVGLMQCMSLLRTNVKSHRGVIPNVVPSGYGPADLQSAYNLAAAAASGGVGATVAVVDAYNDPNAVADLAVYRAQYGLPACNTSTGAGCVTQVNQQGNSSPLPASNAAWAAEESLDLDMVSAICPNCHILLVEATTNALTNLGAADNTAVNKGALFVSNSWNGVEFPSESYYDGVYFNHPRVAIAVASGDSGYGTGWPSAGQYVTSVGGTSLTKDSGVPRGWDESVWNNSGGAAGAGCSEVDPKPAWQTMDNSAPGGCLNRTENDVSAVADPQTGVATYNTYQSTGWSEVGGTSVATPIITSVYALAGNPTAETYPASYPYQSGSATGLYDITTGSNGSCEPARQYLCNAGTGYDGPTGLGTPNGTTAFANTATTDVITLPDPGVQDLEAGSPAFLQMTGLDSAAGQTLTWTATGLPAGLSISASTGRITGTPASATGASTVKVTATDGNAASGSVMFSMVVVPSLAASFHPVAGPMQLDLGGKCLDDANNSTANGNKVQIWACNGGASQNWQFMPDGNPGGAGTLTIHGKCLDIVGRGTANKTLVDLYRCNSGANQQWFIVGSAGEFYNPVSGRCLTDPGGSTTNGTQVYIYDCTGGVNQAWIPAASPVQSGIAGKCMDDTGNGTANGTKIQIWTCSTGNSQKWTVEPDNTLRINGKCLDVLGHSKLDGAAVQLYTCSSNGTTNANQHWIIGPGGQLVNENSGRCLADPGNLAVNGTGLVQEDCYGQPGEVWAVS
jgi:hypothetical protein